MLMKKNLFLSSYKVLRQATLACIYFREENDVAAHSDWNRWLLNMAL